jgi:hypothetical protein
MIGGGAFKLSLAAVIGRARRYPAKAEHGQCGILGSKRRKRFSTLAGRQVPFSHIVSSSRVHVNDDSMYTSAFLHAMYEPATARRVRNVYGIVLPPIDAREVLLRIAKSCSWAHTHPLE